MKIVCVYHSIDLDGWMSAAIVKLWHEKEAERLLKEAIELAEKGLVTRYELMDTMDYIGYNYGQPIPDVSEYDMVIMCDISFPAEDMNRLINNPDNDNFIWLDHHISAISNPEINENWAKGLRDTSFAACELTWQYFFPNEPTPNIVTLLGLYDSFRHKGTEDEQKVLEFQYGARQCIRNYEDAYYYLTNTFDIENQSLSSQIFANGKAIYQYLCTEAQQVYKSGFEIEFHQIGIFVKPVVKFICINKERFNPFNFGIDYHKDGYDGCACFHYANGMWNFSLYNDNGKVDCSQIAKQYGGGGHRGAAGFRCDNETFLKIINNG